MSKAGTPPKVDGISQMTGAQHTPFLQQVESVITDAGGTLIESDSLQFRQALNSYASIANFYIDTGTATEYVLNPQGAFKAPIDAPTTWNGMLIRFRPTNNNTGIATLRLAGLNGGLPFNTLREDGATIQAGDFLTTRDAILRYDSIANACLLLNSNLYAQVNTNATNITANLEAQKRITLSYSNATTINYSAGGFVFDDYTDSGSVTAGTINLATNGIGGLDTRSVAINTAYYLHGYKNNTTGAFGVAMSTSATTSTITGWTRIARIRGAFLLTNATSQIINGIWANLTFRPLLRFNVVALGSPTPTVGTFTPSIPTLSIPHNVVIKGRAVTGTTGSDFLYCNFGNVAEDLVTNYTTDNYHLQSVGDANRFSTYAREIYSTGQFKYQIFTATLARGLYFDIEEIKDNIS